MRDIWERLDAWAGRHLGDAGLRPGCTPEELRQIERRIGRPLPREVRELYSIHDGQGEDAPGLIYGLPLLPLASIASHWQTWAEIADTWDPDDDSQSCLSGQSVKPLYANRGWIPFTHDWGGNHLGVDLDPDEDGVVGQVINFGRDEHGKYVVAESFREFWDWLLERYEGGLFEIKRDPDGEVIFTPGGGYEHPLDAFPRLLRIGNNGGMLH